MRRGKDLYDAIIVGAGHNGLVAANYLAKAGKKVIVLEKRHLVGGAAVTEQLIPGFKFSRCSYVLSLFRRSIIQDLELVKKGLKIHFRDVSSMTPTREVGKYLLMYSNSMEKTKKEIAKFSSKDAQKWEDYNVMLNAICDFWNQRLETLPYNYIQNPTLMDKITFAKSLILKGIYPFELSAFITSSVQTVLNKWFESQILKATLATDGIIGENLSITSNSTAYILLHHVMGQLEEGRKGDWGYVEGGNGKLSSILAKSAESYGAQIQLNTTVKQILFEGTKAVGVEMENGEKVLGKHILSNCTHQMTFEKLIAQPEKVLPAQTLHKIRSVEYNGACTKINLALRSLPKFKCFSQIKGDHERLLTGTIHINCEDLNSLKSSFNETRKHRISPSPFMDVTIPSTLDKTICPPGYHIMNVLMQYTPYHPNTGESVTEISHEEIKSSFLNTINSYLEENLDVHYMDILTPFDLQRLLNLTEGNIFHGSIGLDNLYVHRLSGKVGGVWVCGSSGHPGGGVMGAVGKQISEHILRESS